MIIYILAGVLIGIAGTIAWYNRKSYGTVVVYVPSNPEEPSYLGFKVDKNTSEMYSKSSVRFKVRVENINSQE